MYIVHCTYSVQVQCTMYIYAYNIPYAITTYMAAKGEMGQNTMNCTFNKRRFIPNISKLFFANSIHRLHVCTQAFKMYIIICLLCIYTI